MTSMQRLAAAAVLGGLLLMAAVAGADTITWTGNDGTDFEDALNWTGTTKPPTSDTTTDTASLGGGSPVNKLPQMSASRSIAGVIFTTSGWTLSKLTTQILTVGAVGIDSSVGSGTNTVSANVALGASSTWTVASGNTLLVSGQITGVSGNNVVYDGAGTYQIQGNNNYAGNTNVALTGGGNLRVGSENALGAGVLTLTSGRILLDLAASHTLGNSAVTLAGDMQMGYTGSTATGTLRFTGQATLTGNRTFTLVSDGHTENFQFNGGITEDQAGRGLTLAGGGSSAAAGKNGSVTIGGTANYTGETNINSSTLVVSGSEEGVGALNGRLTASSIIRVQKLGTLALFKSNDYINDAIPIDLYGGTISNSGDNSASLENFGTVTARPGDATIYEAVKRNQGTFTITSLVRDRGTVTFADARGSGGIQGALGTNASVGVIGGDKVFLTGQGAGFIGGWAMVNGNGTVLDFATYGANGVVELGSTVTRPGTVWNAAAGSDVYANTTQFALDTNYSIRSLVMATGSTDLDLAGHRLDITSGGLMLTANAARAIQDTVGGGGLTSSGGELIITVLSNTTTLNAPVLAGSPVSLTKAGAGTLELTGVNTATGNVVVDNGTLKLSNVGAWDGQVTVASDATLTINNINALSSLADVVLLHGGTLYGKLNMLANLTVDTLSLDGVTMAAGTYGSTTSTAGYKDNNFFSGSGVLTVSPVVVPEPATLAFLAIGGLGMIGAAVRRRRTGA